MIVALTTGNETEVQAMKRVIRGTLTGVIVALGACGGGDGAVGLTTDVLSAKHAGGPIATAAALRALRTTSVAVSMPIRG